MSIQDLIPIETQIIEVEPEETEPSAAEIALKLTEKQLKAAENYLIHWDRLRAVKEAYDCDGQVAYNHAHQLFQHNGKVIAYIAARTREMGLPADAVLAKLAEIASFSIEDFLNEEMLQDGKAFFDLAKARELNVMHLVKRIRYLEKGGVELEFYDKMRALELLGKALGMFKETEVKVDNYVIKVVREK
jgi:hypothetical protein